MTQSQEYRDMLQNDDMVHLCKEHSQKGNRLSYACQNATRKANLLNEFNFDVKYDWVRAKQLLIFKL